MNLSTLTQLDQQIAQLTHDEQLWLIERLAHRLRKNTGTAETELEKELAPMAADPEIQRELQKIDEEFRSAEADGLEEY